MSDPINIVTSADDKFAIGLAGTIKSALACLRVGQPVRLFVLDGGITDENKAALVSFWNDPRLAVEWVQIDRKLVSEFRISDHISDATYYRLLAPEVLPQDVSKFIFLDADLLIRRDLAAMWEEPLDGFPCLAIQDVAAPFVDSAIALAKQPEIRRILVNERPIPNYAALQLKPTDPYFNGGVMVVALDHWRREGIALKMLEVLHRHREHVLYWDQYALNVVLSGRWKALDPRWNQNSYVFRESAWLNSSFCLNECPEYAANPWIVHFNWLKPWQADCLHPFADDFMKFLEGSPWHLMIERRTADVAGPQDSSKQRGKSPLRLLRKLRRSVNKIFTPRAA